MSCFIRNFLQCTDEHNTVKNNLNKKLRHVASALIGQNVFKVMPFTISLGKKPDTHTLWMFLLRDQPAAATSPSPYNTCVKNHKNKTPVSIRPLVDS